jgi:hypothetical protein
MGRRSWGGGGSVFASGSVRVFTVAGRYSLSGSGAKTLLISGDPPDRGTATPDHALSG